MNTARRTLLFLLLVTLGLPTLSAIMEPQLEQRMAQQSDPFGEQQSHAVILDSHAGWEETDQG